MFLAQALKRFRGFRGLGGISQEISLICSSAIVCFGGALGAGGCRSGARDLVSFML